MSARDLSSKKPPLLPKIKISSLLKNTFPSLIIGKIMYYYLIEQGKLRKQLLITHQIEQIRKILKLAGYRRNLENNEYQQQFTNELISFVQIIPPDGKSDICQLITGRWFYGERKIISVERRKLSKLIINFWDILKEKIKIDNYRQYKFIEYKTFKKVWENNEKWLFCDCIEKHVAKMDDKYYPIHPTNDCTVLQNKKYFLEISNSYPCQTILQEKTIEANEIEKKIFKNSTDLNVYLRHIIDRYSI